LKLGRFPGNFLKNCKFLRGLTSLADHTQSSLSIRRNVIQRSILSVVVDFRAAMSPDPIFFLSSKLQRREDQLQVLLKYCLHCFNNGSRLTMNEFVRRECVVFDDNEADLGALPRRDEVVGDRSTGLLRKYEEVADMVAARVAVDLLDWEYEILPCCSQTP